MTAAFDASFDVELDKFVGLLGEDDCERRLVAELEELHRLRASFGLISRMVPRLRAQVCRYDDVRLRATVEGICDEHKSLTERLVRIDNEFSKVLERINAGQREIPVEVCEFVRPVGFLGRVRLIFGCGRA